MPSQTVKSKISRDTARKTPKTEKTWRMQNQRNSRLEIF